VKCSLGCGLLAGPANSVPVFGQELAGTLHIAEAENDRGFGSLRANDFRYLLRLGGFDRAHSRQSPLNYAGVISDHEQLPELLQGPVP
jgi:hypothetical protein